LHESNCGSSPLVAGGETSATVATVATFVAVVVTIATVVDGAVVDGAVVDGAVVDGAVEVGRETELVGLVASATVVSTVEAVSDPTGDAASERVDAFLLSLPPTAAPRAPIAATGRATFAHSGNDL